jgi:pyruvate, orthophosphate dikinase
VTAEGWRQLVGEYKAYFKEKTGPDFPEDPEEQLWGAIGAVFESWMGEKAVTYRRVEKITGLLGTAVNVVQMVFGNTGEESGTGVCFTRDPSTGEKKFFGDFLLNAQGEDVVAGIRTPLHLSELKNLMPKVYKQLEARARETREALPRHAGHGIHRRDRHALHAADAQREAFAGSGVSDCRRYGQ